MKSLVLNNINEIEYTDTIEPIAKANEVIVKVMAAGICGSDIPRIYKDGAHKMPLILGHEFAGEVHSVGSETNTNWIGKRVGIFPLIPCKTCIQCQKKRYELCEEYSYLGSRTNGGFAEYVAVPEWNLIELPENVSYEEAAMLEPMAVAVHAMRKAAVKEGDSVLVCGAGTIGSLLVMFLLEKNIKEIFVACNKDFQKKKLLELGVKEDNICDIREKSIREYINKVTNKNGVNVYFDCVGTNDVIRDGLTVTSPMGRICYVGNPHTDIYIDKNIYWQILRKELTIFGTWNSGFAGCTFSDESDRILCDDDDWRYVLTRLNKKTINPTVLITHRLSLDRLIKGLEIMRDKCEDYIKIMCVK